MVCFSAISRNHGEILTRSSTTTPFEPAAWINQAQSLILNWYSRMGRDLPWRHSRDPYAIMISEIMLQQTQVDRVVPKYLEMLAAFPRIEDLAQASLAEILRAWSPLGYNRRARYLHLACREIVDRFNGVFPTEIKALRSIPGLGRYTASAIACFAFEQVVPVVDTNVRRVLSRILVGSFAGVGDSEAWVLAEAALPARHAYDWNQALMDLGAMVCTAESPRCPECPVQSLCVWNNERASATAPARRVREPSAAYKVDGGALRRKWRGRIVNALRDIPPSSLTSWRSIKKVLLDQGAEATGVDLDDLAKSLARDGLIEWRESDDGPQVRLSE
jgi:A/G-specific adenine glycosylase